MKQSYRRTHRLFALMSLLAALLVTGGCGLKQTPPRLQLRSAQSGQVFAQTFVRAFYSSDEAGEHQIVLLDEGTAATAPPAKPGAPLQPSRAAPLRQVVHIRVHWRPIRGTKPDHPSATNAVVDWYVSAPAGTSSDDLLHYRGAAFVELSKHGDLAKVEISNGQLMLVEAAGSLHDPVGTSTISGSFVARRDETMLAAATAPLRLDAAAARARVARPAGAIERPRQGNGAASGQ